MAGDSPREDDVGAGPQAFVDRKQRVPDETHYQPDIAGDEEPGRLFERRARRAQPTAGEDSEQRGADCGQRTEQTFRVPGLGLCPEMAGAENCAIDVRAEVASALENARSGSWHRHDRLKQP